MEAFTEATRAQEEFASQLPAGRKDFEDRPFVERQLAMDLAQLAQPSDDVNVGGGQIANLINTLIVSRPRERRNVFD